MARPDTTSGSDVALDGVGMSYPGVSGATEAVRDVSGVIPDGRFVSVIGPSGCGKSTLLDLVGGLLTPTKGTITIGGDVVNGPRTDTATVFQEDSTLHWRTVLDNVALGLEVRGVAKAERVERAQKMIELVGLKGFEGHRPRQLSGGMRQRVAIARALLLDPRILLMDEPFGALDQQTRRFIGRELIRIWEQTQKSVLFVTHDIAEAVALSDEVWVLSNRPSVVKEVVQIDLGRPRTGSLSSNSAYQDLNAYLWKLIKEESNFSESGTA